MVLQNLFGDAEFKPQEGGWRKRVLFLVEKLQSGVDLCILNKKDRPLVFPHRLCIVRSSWEAELPCAYRAGKVAFLFGQRVQKTIQPPPAKPGCIRSWQAAETAQYFIGPGPSGWGRESSPIVPWAPLFIFVSIWNQNHKTACRAVALLFL